MPESDRAGLQPIRVFNQAVFDVLPVCLAMLDSNGVIQLANAAWVRYGRSLGREEGAVGADYLAARRQAAQTGDEVAIKEYDGLRAVQSGISAQFELEYNHFSPAGTQWFSLRIMSLLDGRGGILLALENITKLRLADLAERNRAEMALQLTQFSVDQVSDGFFWANPEGRLINVNQAACRQTGFSRAELLTMAVPDFCRDLPAEAWRDHWRETKRSGALRIESRCRNRAGVVYPVEISLNYLALGQQELAFMVLRDITERKLVEDEMFNSNEMFRAILDSIPVRVFWKDANLVYQGCNQAFAVDAGCKSPGEVIGSTDFDASWKAKAELYRADDLTVLKTRSPMLNYEEFLPQSDGRPTWLKVSKVPLFDREGKVTGLMGTYEDITERKQFDKILQQQGRWNAFEAEVGLALSENVALPETLQRCADAMVRHLGASLALAWTINQEQTVLELRASAGLSTSLNGDFARVLLGQGNIGMIAREARPLLINDNDPRAPDQAWAKHEGLVAFAGCPLIVECRVEGVLALFARQRLPDHTLKVLATVTRAVAQVIARHRVELALRQSEKRLSTFFRACPVGICISRPADGKFIEVNEVLLSMFGFSREEMLAQTSLELGIWVEPSDRDSLIQKLYEHGRVQQYKARFRRKSGVIGTMMIAAELIELDGEPHVLGTFSDVTASEQQNEELRRAKAAADVANRAKSTFLANMSHEIRTPMNAILGYAQLLQRDQALPVDSKEKLDIISRSGQHLLALIEDVLEMSKIEAGRVPVQPACFNLPGMLADLTAMFRLRTDAKGLEFKLIENGVLPRQIVADEGKFRRVLVNLLGNAVKFTHCGRVELEIGVRRNDHRQLWLSAQVTDTGIGISDDRLAKLFDQFEQAGGDGKYNNGTGLGLAISREYARLMGGDITVTSHEGQGSCFQLTMPVNDGNHDEIVEVVNSRRVIGLRPGQASVLVLLADDNAPNRNWLKQLLTLIGCQVLEAGNGAEAIEVWEKWKPNLILMDLQMPGMDGFEATRRIKASAGGADTVIIALTATVLEESRRAILAAGAADLLGKPMEESMLFDKMHTHLGMEFLYESKAADEPVADTAISPAHQAQSVANLPAVLRAGMRDAIANGDLEGFEARLQEVAAQDPVLARFLRPLAEQYDYDNLLRLLT